MANSLQKRVTSWPTLIFLGGTLLVLLAISPSASSAAERPEAPTLVNAVFDESRGQARLIWWQDGSIDGVNIYRNGSYLKTHNTRPGQVYELLFLPEGGEGDTFYLVAHKDGMFSEKSTEMTVPLSYCRSRSAEPPGWIGARVVPGTASVRITLDRDSCHNYLIYRNGNLWGSMNSSQDIFLANMIPDSEETFEVVAWNKFTFEKAEPKSLTFAITSVRDCKPVGKNAAECVMQRSGKKGLVYEVVPTDIGDKILTNVIHGGTVTCGSTQCIHGDLGTVGPRTTHPAANDCIRRSSECGSPGPKPSPGDGPDIVPVTPTNPFPHDPCTSGRPDRPIEGPQDRVC